MRRDRDVARLLGLGGPPSAAADVVFSPSVGSDGDHASRSTTHGGFDDDASTMNSVALRVLGLRTKSELKRAYPDTGRAFADDPWTSPEVEELRRSFAAAFGGSSTSSSASAPGGALPMPGPSSGPAIVVPSRTGTRRALCIGIDRYPVRPLAGCVADARLWARTLGALGFECTFMLDEEATYSNIVAGLEQLVKVGAAGRLDCLAICRTRHTGPGRQRRRSRRRFARSRRGDLSDRPAGRAHGHRRRDRRDHPATAAGRGLHDDDGLLPFRHAQPLRRGRPCRRRRRSRRTCPVPAAHRGAEAGLPAVRLVAVAQRPVARSFAVPRRAPGRQRDPVHGVSLDRGRLRIQRAGRIHAPGDATAERAGRRDDERRVPHRGDQRLWRGAPADADDHLRGEPPGTARSSGPSTSGRREAGSRAGGVRTPRSRVSRGRPMRSKPRPANCDRCEPCPRTSRTRPPPPRRPRNQPRRLPLLRCRRRRRTASSSSRLVRRWQTAPRPSSGGLVSPSTGRSRSSRSIRASLVSTVRLPRCRCPTSPSNRDRVGRCSRSTTTTAISATSEWISTTR